MSWIFINLFVFLWNLIHATAFSKTFSEEAKAAGGGSALKAAWWLTGNPPAQKGLLEEVNITDDMMRAMTFRMHENKAGVEIEGAEIAEASVPKASKDAEVV